ncbi:MAG: NAD-dependent epimerase/dehydratase family protein [Micromonosporaceae bacterium]
MPAEATGSRTVLVTGVSRYLGAVVAARLAADPGVDRVVAVDTSRPTGEAAALLAQHTGPAAAKPTRRRKADEPAVRRPADQQFGEKLEFVPADIQNPLIAKVIVDSGADSVLHMAVLGSAARGGVRSAAKELNVIGTMQLLAACQKAPAVRKLVVKSSVAAYGASPRDPAMFTEDTSPRETPRGGYSKDIIEIEGYLRGFSRRRPDVAVTVLRFAPFIGPSADTAMTRYFSLPVVPTALGYDPRMQFVHIDDALEVLHRSVMEEHPGVFNVAGDGVLPLSQAIRRAGRVPVPVPEIGLFGVAEVAKRSGMFDFSLDQLDFLKHGRVVDTSRLFAEYGFRPRRTIDAFDDFVRGHELSSVISPDNVAAMEGLLVDQLRQARRSFTSNTAGESGEDG